MTDYLESCPREALIEIIHEKQVIIDMLRKPMLEAAIKRDIVQRPIVDLLIKREIETGFTMAITWPEKIGTCEYMAAETIWGPSERLPDESVLIAVINAFSLAAKLCSWGRAPTIDPSLAMKFLRGEPNAPDKGGA